jgi:UDP-N-acetylglucosamine 1-carboxyvinyltransferase
VTVHGAPCDHLGTFVEVLGRAGVAISCTDDTIEVDASGSGGTARPGNFRPLDIETGPYPGLATDLQPPTCVLLTQADGRSSVHESIFEDRLEWLSELRRMGANVEVVDAQHALIDGPARLRGTELDIPDLRAGASLLLAALAAEGVSRIHGGHHVRRGYENIEAKFLDLGARIERLQEEDPTVPS